MVCFTNIPLIMRRVIRCYSHACPSSWSPCTFDYLPLTLKAHLALDRAKETCFVKKMIFDIPKWKCILSFPFAITSQFLLKNSPLKVHSVISWVTLCSWPPSRKHRRHNIFDTQTPCYLLQFLTPHLSEGFFNHIIHI